MEALRAYWNSREPRERLMLGAGGAIAAILLVYLVIWDPIATERARLARDLPALRTQVAEFRKAADEAEALRGRMRARTSATQPLPQAIQAASQRANLGAPLNQVQSLGADRAQVAASALPFEPFVRWLAQMAQVDGISVETVQATAGAEAGRVQVESLVLRR